MSGPWERYRQQDGPWARYASDRQEQIDAQAAEDAGFTFFDSPRERMAAEMQPSRFEAGVSAAAQGATFGGADELMGLLGGEGARDRTRALLDASRRDYPWMSTAAEVGGAVAAPVGGAGWVGRGANLTRQAGRSALLGGILSGIYGFLSGEGGAEERGRNAAQTGAIGAGIGAAIPPAGRVVDALARRTPRAAGKAMTRATESVDELRAQGGRLFEQARATGQTVDPSQTQALSGRMRKIVEDFGGITPSGRADPGMPAISHALNMAEDFASGPMNPAQYQAFRGAIQRAAGSQNRAERALGMRLLNEFDQFADNLSPLFREGNALLARAHRGAQIEQAIELAGVRAGQFSGSGFENALRTEFRRLSRDIVKGKTRGLTQDQIDAIRRVADGGSVENFMRNIGKAAPTGVVSAGLSGGVPFLVGNAIGGPGLGAAMGVGSMASGAAGRAAATRMQSTNAEIAAALMRSATGELPQLQPISPVVQRLLGPAAAPAASHIQQRR